MVVTTVTTACVMLAGWWCMFRHRTAVMSATSAHSAAVTLDSESEEEAAPTGTVGTEGTAAMGCTTHEANDSGDDTRGPRGSGRDRPVARELLQKATCDELRGLLRSRGLRVSGLKADLIERLLLCSIRSLPCDACCGAVLYASRRSATRVPPQAMNSQPEADRWIAEVLGR
jgi:hypothetical protein